MLAATLIVLMLLCLVLAPCFVARFIRASTYNLNGNEHHTHPHQRTI